MRSGRYKTDQSAGQLSPQTQSNSVGNTEDEHTKQLRAEAEETEQLSL